MNTEVPLLTRWVSELSHAAGTVHFVCERRETGYNKGTTTFRTKIYIYTLPCQWDVVHVTEWLQEWWTVLNFLQAQLTLFLIVSYQLHDSTFPPDRDRGSRGLCTTEYIRTEPAGQNSVAGQSHLYIFIFKYVCVCSSTIICLLFTKPVHTVHPQISMVQLVAPQTHSEVINTHM